MSKLLQMYLRSSLSVKQLETASIVDDSHLPPVSPTSVKPVKKKRRSPRRSENVLVRSSPSGNRNKKMPSLRKISSAPKRIAPKSPSPTKKKLSRWGENASTARKCLAGKDSLSRSPRLPKRPNAAGTPPTIKKKSAWQSLSSRQFDNSGLSSRPNLTAKRHRQFNVSMPTISLEYSPTRSPGKRGRHLAIKAIPEETARQIPGRPKSPRSCRKRLNHNNANMDSSHPAAVMSAMPPTRPRSPSPRKMTRKMKMESSSQRMSMPNIFSSPLDERPRLIKSLAILDEKQQLPPPAKGRFFFNDDDSAAPIMSLRDLSVQLLHEKQKQASNVSSLVTSNEIRIDPPPVWRRTKNVDISNLYRDEELNDRLDRILGRALQI